MPFNRFLLKYFVLVLITLGEIMKKICLFFAIISLFVFVSCGGSENENKNEEPDTAETVTDEDSETTDNSEPSEPSGDTELDDTDTTHEPPDNGDSTPDGDTDTTPSENNDGDDSTDDTDVEGNNNLSECSVSSTTPCYDSTSKLTWSKISASTMPHSAAKTYCSESEMNNYGGFSDWRLPNIDELKTLLVWNKADICQVSEKNNCLSMDGCRTCSTCMESCVPKEGSVFCDSCTGYVDGRFSKLGDGDVYLWSSSMLSDNTDVAWFVNFYTGSVDPGYFGDRSVRCVRSAE